jgi:hypothetical protein
MGGALLAAREETGLKGPTGPAWRKVKATVAEVKERAWEKSQWRGKGASRAAQGWRAGNRSRWPLLGSETWRARKP